MAWRLFLTLFCVFMLATSREPPWADAHVVYDTTRALVDRLGLDVTLDGPPWFYSIHHGKKFGVFPLGNVLAMVPSYLVFKALGATHLFPIEPLYALCAHLSPAALMAGAMVLLYRLALRRASQRDAALLTLATALSTLTLCYARSVYSEALQTAALLWVVHATLTQGDRMTPAGMLRLGAAAGVLFNTKLVYALLMPLPAAYLIGRFVAQRAEASAPPSGDPGAPRRVPDLRGLLVGAAAAIAGFLPFLALALWHNWLKSGSPFITGYQIPEGIFSGDLLPGLYGFFFSTGKSAFLYSPPLVLGVLGVKTAWRRARAETAFLLAVIAAVTLWNAKFRHWHADYCWGPRHLVPVTPLVMLLALPWLPEALTRGRVRVRRALVGWLVALGLCVQLLGAAFYWDHYIRILIAVKDQTGAAGWFHEQLGHGHYIPQFSPLRGHLWLLGHMVRRDPDLGRDVPWRLIVPQRPDLREAWQRLRVDWWPLDWGSPGGRRTLPVFIVLLAGGALLGAAGLRRRLRAPGQAAPAQET